MTKFILLQLLLLLADTGSSETWKRLIGGGKCRNNERRHQVWVFHHKPDGKRSFCGGTLIGEKWALTASHCYNRAAGGNISVKVGIHPKNNQIQSFNINLRDIHSYGVTESAGDIMLIKLPKAVSGIVPARLPPTSCQTPSNGEVLQLAGHGSTVSENGPADRNKPLQCLDLIVTSSHNPKNNYFYGEGLPNNPPANVCPGDSGGGWMKKTTGVIYGVLRGAYITCNTNIKFTSVCAHPIRQWITNITGL